MEDKTCEWCGTTASGDAVTCPICRQPFGLGIGLPAAMVPAPRTTPPAHVSTPAPEPVAETVPASSRSAAASVPEASPALADDVTEPFAVAAAKFSARDIPTLAPRLRDQEQATHESSGDTGEIDPVDASLHHLADELRNPGVRMRRSRGRFGRRTRKAERKPVARETTPTPTRVRAGRQRNVRLAFLVAGCATVLAVGALALRETLPADQVRDTVHAYYDADTCLDRIELVSGRSAPIARACDDTAPEKEFSGVEVGDVKVDGDEATAEVRLTETLDGTSSVQSFEQELVKEDGDWRLLLTED